MLAKGQVFSKVCAFLCLGTSIVSKHGLDGQTTESMELGKSEVYSKRGLDEPMTGSMSMRRKLLSTTQGWQLHAHPGQCVRRGYYPPHSSERTGGKYLEILQQSDLPLADAMPDSPISYKIDILIGADYYWQVVGTERRQLPSGVYLLASTLGYLTTGKMEQYL